MSFFQPKQYHPLQPSTHQSAAGVVLWAQEAGVAAEKEEEGLIGLDTKHMVDVHAMDMAVDGPMSDGYAPDGHTPDGFMSSGYAPDGHTAEQVCTRQAHGRWVCTRLAHTGWAHTG